MGYPDHRPPLVTKTLGGSLVALGLAAGIVRWSVDEHGDGAAGQVVDEVGLGSRSGYRHLRPVRAGVTSRVEPLQEPSLQAGLHVLLEELTDVVAGPPAGTGGRRATGQLEEQVAGGVTIDVRMVELVGIRQEAVVAALLAAIVTGAEILAGVGIEVGAGKRFPRHSRYRVRLQYQAAEDTCPAFCRLREEHAATVVVVGQLGRVELGVLELEGRLDATFDRIPERRYSCRAP